MSSHPRLTSLVAGSAAAALLVTGLTVAVAQSASASTSVPACTGRDLTETVYLGGGAGGTRYGDIELADKTSHRCELNVRAHSMYFTADGHGGKVGAWGAYEFETIHPGTGTAARKYFNLSAHGGHAYIRIGVADYADTTRVCDPVEVSAIVTHVQGSSIPISGAIPFPLTICSNTRVRELHFGQYRTHRSTSVE